MSTRFIAQLKPKKNGKILSWHSHTSQWYITAPVLLDDGQIIRKRLYLGSGRSLNDRKSYEDALTKYERHMHHMELVEAQRAFYQRLQTGEVGSSPIEAWIAEHRPEAYDTGLSDDEWGVRRQQAIALRGLRAAPALPPTQRSTSIPDQVERWLASEELRAQASDLTSEAMASKRQGIKTFVEFASSSDAGFDQGLSVLISEYRNHLLSLRASNTYRPHTINDKLKFVGQFIQWAYELEILPQLPRNLNSALKKLPVTKSGKPLPLATVRAIWSAANLRMKCFIALGLNCGFKNKDICVLRTGDLRGNRLISTRSKTGAPMNYLLWPLTLDLMARTRQDNGSPNETLFRAQDDSDLKPGTLSALFKKAAKRASAQFGTTKLGHPKYATFEQLRDTSVEQMKKSINKHGRDPSLLQLFLAHKDASTAAYYTSNDPASMRSEALDREIGLLEEYFGLYPP